MLTFWSITNLLHEDILKLAHAKKVNNLVEVQFNSIYRGTGVPEGKKTMHYSFVYQSLSDTLTDEIVNTAQENLIKRLEKDSRISFKSSDDFLLMKLGGRKKIISKKESEENYGHAKV